MGYQNPVDWRRCLAVILLALSPAVYTAKTFSLDLIEARGWADFNELQKRQQSGNGFRTTDLTYNSSTFDFFVDVNIGNENANFKLSVIQNPHTWVARRWNSTLQCHPADNCAASNISGFFSYDDPASSTSYTNLSDFSISYTDGRYAYGQWARDSFRLGQLNVPDVNFGIVDTYNATPALGLEKSASNTPYSTFLEVMLENDMINTLTYGIYIGDARARDDTGKSISFGGIDIAKFKKPLKTYDSTTVYNLDLIGVDIIVNGETTETPLDPDTDSPVIADLSFGSP
ncbi:Candidapepsin-7 [Dactylella cylindrospora]|nr:Candidapepsin-7 [Dactylella cylindrospora]